jgi:hypothetical protein
MTYIEYPSVEERLEAELEDMKKDLKWALSFVGSIIEDDDFVYKEKKRIKSYWEIE